MSKEFRPSRPWPTATQEARFIFRLLGMVTLLQFMLNAAENLVRGIPMVVAWLVAGGVVAAATIRIEKYFQRQRRIP